MMDEKRPTYTPTRHSRRSRSILILLLTAFLGYTIWQTSATPRTVLDSLTEGGSLATQEVGRLVPLEAHIMSKCPDARDCLRDMILPVMMRAHDKVNWTLSFVGTPTENDGVDCKHGPSECMGNIIELCAAKLYPDPKINLGFTMCITRQYKEIPERTLIEDCALEHAMDIKLLNECAAREDGAYGIGMLRDSVKRTADVRNFSSWGIYSSHTLTNSLSPRRPASRSAAPCASTRRSTASGTGPSGCRARTARESTI